MHDDPLSVDDAAKYSGFALDVLISSLLNLHLKRSLCEDCKRAMLLRAEFLVMVVTLTKCLSSAVTSNVQNDVR